MTDSIMSRTQRRVAVSCALGIFLVLPCLRWACRKESPLPLLYNFENESPALLEKETSRKLGPGVRVGCQALCADWQIYREWYKLTANTPEDIDRIVAKLMAENELISRRKFSYQKSSLNDPRIYWPGNNAPAWWNPGSIQSGYSLVSDEPRSGSFMIDISRQLVYFINTQ